MSLCTFVLHYKLMTERPGRKTGIKNGRREENGGKT
jgi:hypothetical protein